MPYAKKQLTLLPGEILHEGVHTAEVWSNRLQSILAGGLPLAGQVGSLEACIATAQADSVPCILLSFWVSNSASTYPQGWRSHWFFILSQ